ncbi:hypothetical protein B4893_10265 [Staphylococcus aureus]|nr:hypothetical protein B4893_10265 [Staphylococcus aureus]
MVKTVRNGGFCLENVTNEEVFEIWYSPVVCMALSKAHNINFYDSDDVGCIDKAATCSIKKFNPETGEFEQFSKMAQKEITQ